MPRPKKYFFIVELTDTRGSHGEREVRNIVANALDLGFHYNDTSEGFENIQVKNFKSVVRGLQQQNIDIHTIIQRLSND